MRRCGGRDGSQAVDGVMGDADAALGGGEAQQRGALGHVQGSAAEEAADPLQHSDTDYSGARLRRELARGADRSAEELREFVGGGRQGTDLAIGESGAAGPGRERVTAVGPGGQVCALQDGEVIADHRP
jgi:hypothetical protein